MSITPQETMPHNGQLLQKIMTEKRFTRSQLAEAFNKQTVTIFRLIENPSIKSQDLWLLSSVMKVNMFQELAKCHPVQTPTETELALQQRITELEIELRVCKELLKGK
jgi:hypothetical protein